MKIKWLICYIYAGGLGPARACSLVIQSTKLEGELSVLQVDLYSISTEMIWRVDLRIILGCQCAGQLTE